MHRPPHRDARPLPGVAARPQHLPAVEGGRGRRRAGDRHHRPAAADARRLHDHRRRPRRRRRLDRRAAVRILRQPVSPISALLHGAVARGVELHVPPRGGVGDDHPAAVRRRRSSSARSPTSTRAPAGRRTCSCSTSSRCRSRSCSTSSASASRRSSDPYRRRVGRGHRARQRRHGSLLFAVDHVVALPQDHGDPMSVSELPPPPPPSGRAASPPSSAAGTQRRRRARLEVVRRPRRRVRRVLHRRRRRHRAARPERRRQVDDAAHAVRADRAVAGHRPRARPATRARDLAAHRAHRPRAAAGGHVRARSPRSSSCASPACSTGSPIPTAPRPRALAVVELDPTDPRRLPTYSKGMRQRVKVAQALVHDPQVIVLDEPLTGLDPRQRLHMIELFHRLGATGKCVLVSSHVLDEVERFGSRVLVIAQGRLAAEGDFRAIRDLMDDRPHRIRVRTDRPRALASRLIARPGRGRRARRRRRRAASSTPSTSAAFRQAVAARRPRGRRPPVRGRAARRRPRERVPLPRRSRPRSQAEASRAA